LSDSTHTTFIFTFCQFWQSSHRTAIIYNLLRSDTWYRITCFYDNV